MGVSFHNPFANAHKLLVQRLVRYRPAGRQTFGVWLMLQGLCIAVLSTLYVALHKVNRVVFAGQFVGSHAAAQS